MYRITADPFLLKFAIGTPSNSTSAQTSFPDLVKRDIGL